MILVEDFYQRYLTHMSLELITGVEGLNREIKVAEIHRGGLALTGYLDHHIYQRILLFGKVEIEYLRTLESDVIKQRIKTVLNSETPLLIVSKNLQPLPEIIEVCQELNVSLMTSSLDSIDLMNRVTLALMEEFAPVITKHGTFLEVYDVGVLLEGDSSVGKSETALGLIARGHRLISDDVVRIKKKGNTQLTGHGAELTRHHMEVRGIGIINVANLYGAFCVRDQKNVDLVVKLEIWDEDHFYDRVGVEDQTCEILGVKVPYSLLPVKPGRDVVLLLEALALNQRLKKMGYHSAKDFKQRQSKQIRINQGVSI